MEKQRLLKAVHQKVNSKLLINKWTYTQPLLWKEMQNNVRIGYYFISVWPSLQREVTSTSEWDSGERVFYLLVEIGIILRKTWSIAIKIENSPCPLAPKSHPYAIGKESTTHARKYI